MQLGSHPNYHMVDTTTPPRRARKDIHDLRREVESYNREPLYQEACQHLQNQESYQQLQYEYHLRRPPPSIATEERWLLRQTKAVLTHNAFHLFNRPAKPTQLTPQPIRAPDFLNLDIEAEAD